MGAGARATSPAGRQGRYRAGAGPSARCRRTEVPHNWPIGQCRVCLGWGEKPQYADCVACSSWRQRYPGQGLCRRCGHDSHVNTDGLCRLCLLTIRLHDPEWIAHPVSGRPSQLMLILPGDRLPTAQPLDRPLRGRAPSRTRPRSLLDQLRIASAEPIDDPRICLPAIRGQLLLFRPHRQLTDIHARRIRHRDLDGYDRLRETAIALAAERGLSTAWWRGTCLMLRLALAIREADGDDHVPEEALDDLPRFRNAVADVLRHAGLTGAGMLRPRRGTRPVVLRNPQRSCGHCDCWGSREICEGCSSWKHPNHPVGDCTRCRREGIPLLSGLCRACCLHIDQHGPEARTQAWTQLWFGGELAPRLAVRPGMLGYVPPHQKARARAAARRPPAPPVSPHLAVPGQTVLFDARRDWSCIAVGSLGQLPSLTPGRTGPADRVPGARRGPGMGRGGPPPCCPEPADRAGVDRRRRPDPRSRHPQHLHRSARHQRAANAAVPGQPEPDHP